MTRDTGDRDPCNCGQTPARPVDKYVPSPLISVDSPTDRARWALALNCTEAALLEAIEYAGLSRARLQKYLKERRTPPL